MELEEGPLLMSCLPRLYGERVSVLVLLGVALTAAGLGGCRSLEPAPVDSRDMSGDVPAGYLRVQPGDSLSAVAWLQGLDYHRLAEWNGIAPPYVLHPGQLLRIQPPEGTLPPSRPGAGPAPKDASPPPKQQAKPPRPIHPVASSVIKAKPTERASARPVKARTALGSGWQWPLAGKVVQGFRRGDRTRRGIRIAGPAGAKVVAAEAGTVVYSGSGLVGYGNLIILEHTDDYLSAYGFNRKLLVKEGDSVAPGEQVAELGQAPSGQYLLHFEIRHKGSAVDPLTLLPAR